MRLSDLLHKPVVDAAGRSLGKVSDVPLVRNGPEVSGFGATYAVAGLRVSARSGNFFGYEREDERSTSRVRAL